jgi:transposase InsO family protein
MSRSGNDYDNAPAESSISTLAMELVPPEGQSSGEKAYWSIFEYVKGFYNTWRGIRRRGIFPRTRISNTHPFRINLVTGKCGEA